MRFISRVLCLLGIHDLGETTHRLPKASRKKDIRFYYRKCVRFGCTHRSYYKQIGPNGPMRRATGEEIGKLDLEIPDREFIMLIR